MYSNIGVTEKSVLRVLKKKNWKRNGEMVRDQQEVNLSDCGEKLFCTSDTARSISMHNGNF